MSRKPNYIDEDIYNYIIDNCDVEDEFLHRITIESRWMGMPDISISPDQAAFLQVFIKSMNPKKVLEIGTLSGYSAIVMARVMSNDSELRTIELNPKFADYALIEAKKAGLDHIINVVCNDAFYYMDLLGDEAGTYDIIFMDADKERYPQYLDKCLKLLRVGGVLIIDNTLAFGDIVNPKVKARKEEVEAIRELNQLIKERKDLISSHLTIGDGMILAYKNRD